MAARLRHALPPAVYALAEAEPGTVLLEGADSRKSENADGPGNGEPGNGEPWTRLFLSPARVCAAWKPDEVPALFAEVERALAAGQYAAGFFSYECGVAFEPKAKVHEAGERPLAPLAWLGIYDRACVFDHETGAFAGELPQNLKAALEQPEAAPEANASADPLAARFALTEADYARRIAAIHEWIRTGDVYQLNFTAPFRLKAAEAAAALYRRLRARQPAQYGAFVHWQPGRHILSFSPELFFRIDGAATAGGYRRIVARPMKGTAPRGRTTQEDREIAEWLRSDEKNRSENLMIVDLIRNDLGRVARFGTVRTENLFAVERLPTLWQMTSTVTAELREDAGLEAIFRALFPSGSITGAPKVRAMQLIARLEDAPRGVYTGSIGFFSPRQAIFNVAIRTLALEGVRGVMGVGSGIVIDSEPAAEYRECLLKAEFLTRAARPQPGDFLLIETMLWNGCYPLLDLHLDRLADSAEYFDFVCRRGEVKAALEERAGAFGDSAPRRVRLLLARDGGVQIADEGLPAPAPPDAILRAGIAASRTDPADAFLYHKTTHRPLYAEAFQAASRAGFADLLFFNLRGELTEGAISNVFVEKNGRWFTPPVKCGLLPGVYRRHMLASQPQIEERVLSEDDLRAADAVYLANAVRGLRRIEIDWSARIG
jgi:para-aminobenzoate synthetase/4-amino-4-deoxychorismate lyase